MSQSIAPIETNYAGCRFRSRLEARWAVFLDRLNITWEHEPDSFQTSAGAYLPDFKIELPDDPSHPYWLEVKPDDFIQDDRHRALAAQSGMPLIVARGMPRDYRDQLRSHTSPLQVWTGEDTPRACAFVGQEQGVIERIPAEFVERIGYSKKFYPGACRWMQWDSIHRGRPWFMEARDGIHIGLYGGDPLPYDSPDIDAAYTAARSARFGR